MLHVAVLLLEVARLKDDAALVLGAGDSGAAHHPSLGEFVRGRGPNDLGVAADTLNTGYKKGEVEMAELGIC